jgi:sugar lactone lactonase YvrE
MNAVPDAVTSGELGMVWFEDNYGNQRAIGRITPHGAVKEFTHNLGTGLQDDITLGADGNVWVEQSMPGGIARIKPQGTITEFTHGLLPGAGSDGDQIVTGPDGNLWFSDRGAKAIGRVSLQIPPTVGTGKLAEVTRTGGKVIGYVDPLGSATKVKVQYGKSRSLGSTSAVTSVPASGETLAVKVRLSNLPSGTAIYYRVVATNAFGTARGVIRKFRTKHA